MDVVVHRLLPTPTLVPIILKPVSRMDDGGFDILFIPTWDLNDFNLARKKYGAATIAVGVPPKSGS